MLGSGGGQRPRAPAAPQIYRMPSAGPADREPPPAGLRSRYLGPRPAASHRRGETGPGGTARSEESGPPRPIAPHGSGPRELRAAESAVRTRRADSAEGGREALTCSMAGWSTPRGGSNLPRSPRRPHCHRTAPTAPPQHRNAPPPLPPPARPRPRRGKANQLRRLKDRRDGQAIATEQLPRRHGCPATWHKVTNPEDSLGSHPLTRQQPINCSVSSREDVIGETEARTGRGRVGGGAHAGKGAERGRGRAGAGPMGRGAGAGPWRGRGSLSFPDGPRPNWGPVVRPNDPSRMIQSHPLAIGTSH